MELSEQMVRRENTVSKGPKNKTGQTEKIADGLTQKVPYPNCSAQKDCLARNQLCCLTQIESYSVGDCLQLQDGSCNWAMTSDSRIFSNEWYTCIVWFLTSGLDVVVCLSRLNTCTVISRKQVPNPQVSHAQDICGVQGEKSHMWRGLHDQTTNSVLRFLSCLKIDSWLSAEDLIATLCIILEILLKHFYARWVRPVTVRNPFRRIQYGRDTQLKVKVL